MTIPQEQEQEPNQDQQTTHTLTSCSNRLTVSLTHTPIDVPTTLASVKDPSAGAVVLFAGTTRDFSGRPAKRRKTGGGALEQESSDGMKRTNEEEEEERGDQQEYASVSKLTYTSYIPLALKTMQKIGETAFQSTAPHNGVAEPAETSTPIRKISMVHRLGIVPIMEESVVICVSAEHRQEGWQCGEWLLEEVKRRVEVWKWEEFVDGVAVGEGDGGVTKVGTGSATTDTDADLKQNDDSGTWRSNTNDDRHTAGYRRRGARIAGAPRV
ncbi:MAG: Molybdopterin synthase catalytic subunit [Alyxoria varia]|nr:MAG: Molybdopterin synthase catalytic subunit [Alyxoria varia]